MRRKLALALFLFAAAVRANELRVLFVGNSLTYVNDMPAIANRIAHSLDANPSLIAEFAGFGGATFKQQYDSAATMRAIREGKYAYVVLQAQSSEVVRNPAEAFRYARLLDAEIRRSGARTIVFETWAPRNVPYSQEEFNRAYEQLARDLHAPIARVGVAWQELQRDGVNLFNDAVHPNANGSYLAACVFYALLYKHSPEGAAHDGVAGGMAALIEREAWKVAK